MRRKKRVIVIDLPTEDPEVEVFEVGKKKEETDTGIATGWPVKEPEYVPTQAPAKAPEHQKVWPR